MMKKKQFFILFLYIIAVCFFLLNTYKSDTTTEKLVHISSFEFGIWTVIILFCIRMFTKGFLHPTLLHINNVLLSVAISFGLLLTLWDALAPPNYVYSKTSLQYPQIFFLGLFGASVWLLNQSDKWFAKNYNKLIFVGSFVCIALAFIVSYFPQDIFVKLTHEDNFIENTQVVTLLLGTLFSAKIAALLMKKTSGF